MISKYSGLALVFATVISSNALATPSISNCGTPTDLFSGVQVSISPDPIEKGKPFTLSFVGNLGLALAAGFIDWNLDAKITILGEPVFDRKMRSTSAFEISPGFVPGRNVFTVGPVSLPRGIPGGGADISGNVTIKNKNGQQAACVHMELHMVLGSDGPDSAAGLVEQRAQSSPFAAAKNCGTATDHMQNITISAAHGLAGFSGQLDETLTNMSIDTKLELSDGFFPLPLRLHIPMYYYPGIVAGPVAVRLGGALAESEFAPRAKLKGVTATGNIVVTGDVVWNDAVQQQIACMRFDRDEDISVNTFVV